MKKAKISKAEVKPEMDAEVTLKEELKKGVNLVLRNSQRLTQVEVEIGRVQAEIGRVQTEIGRVDEAIRRVRRNPKKEQLLREE